MENDDIDISNCDFIPSVYDHLKKQWESSKLRYSEFINNISLGIVVNKSLIQRERGLAGDILYTDYYEVVDKNKWLIAKLKYGF